MLTRFDLYYKIQKNVFMSGRISSDAYTIYYSDEQDIPYCNYAVVSDLSSVSRLLNSISEDFAKIDRKPCIYINSNQSNELRELQEYNMHVRYMEVCLRYGGGRPRAIKSSRYWRACGKKPQLGQQISRAPHCRAVRRAN